MNASLDTDIVIHLYLSDQKGLLFRYFDVLYMHGYLYENELKRKSLHVYNEFTEDLKSGKVEVISNKDLFELGIKVEFEKLIREYENLFDSGEMYAVALAKTMGIAALVSDDTKDFGPHQTLVKELVEEVIPFAFYELLFLDYLSGKITVQEMQQQLLYVTDKSMNKHPMNFRDRLLGTVRRFSNKNGTDRDYTWVQEFCGKYNVDYRFKMKELKVYLSQIK